MQWLQAQINVYLDHERQSHQPPDPLPGSLHIRVEVAVVSKHLDLCWEAVMVDAVLWARLSLLAPVDDDLSEP